MKLNSAKPNFVDRLRNYSRVVSTKLELNRHSAGKIAALSAAAGAALSAHHAAEATIITSGPVNLNVTASFGYGGGIASFSINGLANFGISAAWLPYFYGLRQVGFGTTGATNSTGVPGPLGEQIVWAPGGGGQNQPDKLAAGVSIDGSSPWFAPAINPGNGNKALVTGTNYSPSQAGNNWPNPGVGSTTSGFAGIRFDTAGAASKHYGWVRLQLTSDGFNRVTSITVLDWAYDDTPGAAILAGQVPEPSTVMLGTLGALALGASGIRAQRRRRREQAV